MTLSRADGSGAEVPVVGAGVPSLCGSFPPPYSLIPDQLCPLQARRQGRSSPGTDATERRNIDKCSEWRDWDSVLRARVPHRGSNQSKAVELDTVRGTWARTQLQSKWLQTEVHGQTRVRTFPCP